MLYSYICLFALSLAFYRRRENISFYVINMFVIKWRQTRWCLFFSHSLLYVLYNHDRKMYELVFVVSVLYPVSIKQLRVEYWFDVLWIYSRYNELETRKGTNPPGNMSVCVCELRFNRDILMMMLMNRHSDSICCMIYGFNLTLKLFSSSSTTSHHDDDKVSVNKWMNAWC